MLELLLWLRTQHWFNVLATLAVGLAACYISEVVAPRRDYEDRSGREKDAY